MQIVFKETFLQFSESLTKFKCRFFIYEKPVD